MATFRVGQRVRIRNDLPLHPEAERIWGDLRGVETTLEERTPFMDTPTWPRFWRVAVLNKYGEPVYVSELGLVPLTDPKASEFIERIKKLGREPVSARERAGEALDLALRENAERGK